MAMAISPRRGGRLLVAGAAVVIGLAAGRFVTYEPADRAERGNPTDAESLQALGASYLRSAIQTGDPSFYDLADRALADAAELAPGDGETTLLQGQLALSLHQFDEALILGERAVDAMPRDADARLVVVDAQVELGRYEEAAITLQDALDLQPGLAALSRASYLRELRGDLPGALLAMQQAQTAGGGAFELATVTALVGDLHLRAGDVAAALLAYEDALQLVPDLVAAQTGRARALVAGGRVEEARTLLVDVVQAVPGAAAAQLLSDLHRAAGDAGGAEEADALVRAAASLQEAAGGEVDLEMALFEADHGDAQVALDRAERVHRARPTVYAADAVAWSLYRAGRADEALPYVEDALRLGTADPMLHIHAAAVLADVGDQARAAEELRRAFLGQPWFLPPDDGLVTTLAADLGVDVPPSWASWSVP